MTATLLVVILLMLTPLAHGSPVDPSSLGFWDNADFDDVILFLTSDLHLIHSNAGALIGAFTPMRQIVVGGVVGCLAQRPYSPGTPRGPPAS